jgi:hypothetical protein
MGGRANAPGKRVHALLCAASCILLVHRAAAQCGSGQCSDDSTWFALDLRPAIAFTRARQPRAPAEPFLTPDVCAAASCRAAAATVERGITAGTVTTSAVKKRIHVVQANTQTRDRHRAATVRLGSIRADLRRRPALDAALEGTKTAPDIHLARSVLMARSSRMTGTAAA